MVFYVLMTAIRKFLYFLCDKVYSGRRVEEVASIFSAEDSGEKAVISYKFLVKI
jgi:hypothetical protein